MSAVCEDVKGAHTLQVQKSSVQAEAERLPLFVLIGSLKGSRFNGEIAYVTVVELEQSTFDVGLPFHMWAPRMSKEEKALS